MLHISQELVADGPAGHSYRAVNYNNIFFFCPQVRPFKFIGSIAFVSGHKAGCHLNARSPHLHKFINISTCINSACRNNRNRFVVLIFK